MELHDIDKTLSQPIGLTREMLGIEETGAVVAGRNQKNKRVEEIKVGDEVHSDCYNPHLRGIVTYILRDRVCIIWKSGWVGTDYAISEFKKTGRHFDIDRIWREMERWTLGH